MPIIIDGWNLVRSERSAIDDLEGDSLESAEALIGCLADFQRKHKDPIILVFDSSNEYLGLKYTGTEKLKVVAAKNADAYIKKYIDDLPAGQRANLRVVSSDNEIYFYARSSSAKPVKSEEFWNKLIKP
jgi:predicted RNA-binding protein with PIN domain